MERMQTETGGYEQKLRYWVDHYADAILRTCFLYLSDRALAEDALQDTFVKAWKHMDDVVSNGIENEKAWLMRIAINTCKDYWKTTWWKHIDRRQALEGLPHHLMQTQDANRELTLTVMELPVRYKQVVLLYYFQGLTQQETAQVLGLSPAAVARRLRAAEKMLKEWMAGGEENDE